MLKKIIKLLIGILVVACIALGFIGNFFYNVAISAKNDKKGVTSQDHFEKPKSEMEALKWYDDNDKNKVSIKSVAGFKLVGHEFIHENHKTNKWIIVVHGYSNKARLMGYFIKWFYGEGYNVLAPDLLASGESEGDFYSMGGFDAYDLANWTKEITKKDPTAKIVIYGVSMGGTTVINSLNKGLSPNVVAFIEDSAYLNLKHQLGYELHKLYKLPEFPIIDASSIVTRIRAGYFLDDVDATNALKSTKLPGLILHGEADSFVPVENAKKIYSLIPGDNKEIYTFPKARHIEARLLYSNEYWSDIKNFLNKYDK